MPRHASENNDVSIPEEVRVVNWKETVVSYTLSEDCFLATCGGEVHPKIK